MTSWFSSLSASGFMPHGHCYLWDPRLVWTMVAADLLIGFAYVAISLTLYILVRRVKLPYHTMFLAFGLFIIACGATHFMEVYTLWIPNYWLAAAVKIATATASVVTAVYLFKLFPQIVELTAAAGELIQTKSKVEEFFYRRLSTPPEVGRLLRRTITLPIFLAVGLLTISLFEANYLRNTEKWVEHGNEVLRLGHDLKTYAAEAQSEFRAYKFSNSAKYKETSLASQRQFDETYTTLADNTTDNPTQLERLRKIKTVFDQWREFIKPYANGDLRHDDKRLNEFLDQNSALKDATTNATDDFVHNERALRAQRAEQTKYIAGIIFITIGILAGLLGIVFAFISRNSVYQVSTSYGRALESERASRENAEKAIAARDEFLSLASHELRTPLTSLKLQLQMAERRGRNEPEQTPFLKQLGDSVTLALRQVDSLTALVDDLLDTSRIQSGKFTLNQSDEDLSDVVEDVVRKLSAPLQLAKCRIELDLTKPLIGHWDRRRLEQIVANLISNAIKYAPNGSIQIATRLQEDKALLTVCDDGPGIAAELQARIFERFERGASTEHTVGGLGLGLYIVKGIVESKGGSIRVESSPGQGAKFVVELPLQPRHTNT